MSDPSPIDDRLEAVDEPRLLRFLEHVEKLRGGRLLIARRDLDPVDFPWLLGDVVLVDVEHDPLRFRYRLVGTNLVSWRGYDLTGRYVDEHPDERYRSTVWDHYARTVAARQITGGCYRLQIDGRPRTYQVVRVPLAGDGETIDMIAAAFALSPLRRPA